MSEAGIPPPGAEPPRDDGILRAAPGLARIAAVAWWRTAQWTVRSSLSAYQRAVRAAVRGESTELLQETVEELREHMRELLGLNARDGPPEDEASLEALRERGAELLRRSADVYDDDDAHPAYARILCDLSPDEARILRLLAKEGPRPAVDVRTGRPLNIGSQLIAPGLTMIGAEAGARHLDRVQSYLNNLYRLGLLWFSREQLEDPLEYQVLEAQPEVLEAMREAGRAKTIRRTIHLTPFGDDFCEVCGLTVEPPPEPLRNE